MYFICMVHRLFIVCLTFLVFCSFSRLCSYNVFRNVIFVSYAHVPVILQSLGVIFIILLFIILHVVLSSWYFRIVVFIVFNGLPHYLNVVLFPLVFSCFNTLFSFMDWDRALSSQSPFKTN